MDSKLQLKKIELLHWLSNLEDSAMIEKLMKLYRKEKGDWWDSLSSAEKASIQQGIKEADNNNLKAHSEAQKIYEKWLHH